MLKKFNKYIKKVIEDRVKSVLNETITKKNNPFEVNFADYTSVIHRPHTLTGGKKIYVGSQSRLGKYAWLAAYENYLAQSFSPNIKIGSAVNIGSFACITCVEEIIIEDGCLFSEHVYISDHYHGFDPKDGISPALQPLYSKGPVHIGKNTFLGLRVCILPGVKLGKHCIVGANSVVTKSFPDYCMLAGSPARVIKKFDLYKNEWVAI